MWAPKRAQINKKKAKPKKYEGHKKGEVKNNHKFHARK